MKDRSETGFRVYRIKDGYESGDRYAWTEDGELLRETARGWESVPKRGEYLIVWNHSPKIERW